LFFDVDVGFVWTAGGGLSYELRPSYGRPGVRMGNLVDLEDIGKVIKLASKAVSVIACYRGSLVAVGFT
jgi:hypothetical protein